MSWLKIDDGFTQHPKIVGLSDKAFRLHMVALCYCAQQLTDGILAPGPIKACCGIAGATRKHVNELADTGVWSYIPNGFVIRDYLDFNPSRRDVTAKREAAKERMALARSSREQDANNARSSPNPVPSPARKNIKAVVDESLRGTG